MRQTIFLLLLTVHFTRTENEGKLKCSLESLEPPYQPNIYLCSTGYSCCRVFGQVACCANDIEWQNFLLYFCFALIALLIAWGVQLYFEDDDPSVIMYASDKTDCNRLVFFFCCYFFFFLNFLV
ncbi:unnamed protein product [Enterobius vermicularis]|uniref:CX domain-containing protein n=1 Tax=Enterobius vermicularis TaxID=51028 RepID=A0A0N4VPD7_ENTVE|nr:unnamed protein product [Enterobius vermicularis]